MPVWVAFVVPLVAFFALLLWPEKNEESLS